LMGSIFLQNELPNNIPGAVDGLFEIVI